MSDPRPVPELSRVYSTTETLLLFSFIASLFPIVLALIIPLLSIVLILISLLLFLIAQVRLAHERSRFSWTKFTVGALTLDSVILAGLLVSGAVKFYGF